MKSALVIVLLFVVQALSEQTFDDYKKKYGKQYSETESKKAKAAFEENSKRMEKHNKDSEASYVQGPNENSDQKQPQQAGNPADNIDFKNVKQVKNKVKGLPTDLPKTVNYGSKLPAIVDQKTCRGDYVLSVLPIYSFLTQNKTVFSAQDIIDCDKTNAGCSGGNVISAMLHIQVNGLSDGNKYKWAAKNQTCQKKKYPAIIEAKNLQPCGVLIDGKKYDAEFMKMVVAQYGPVVVLMNAFMKSKGFMSYKSGIFDDATCSKNITLSDSWVTIVGYGTDAKFGDFWSVRNSYGTSWGEKGYFRIKRGNNTCGIENIVLLPCSTS